MKRLWMTLGVVGAVVWLATPAGAQDYRARVQGQIVDESRGALPGVTVTMQNDATGVASDRVTDAEGRYRFDFVEPGTYSVTAALQGFRSRIAEERARTAARRRDRRPGDGPGHGRRDDHGAGLVAAGAVQFEQLRPDARAAAGRPGADQRAQSVQPGEPRSVDRQHARDDGRGEPSVPSRLRQRLRRRRRHTPRQRGVARRRVARRQLQDVLHPVDGRGRRNHGLEEQRRCRERQQPRRPDQPEHEVGHQHVPRVGLFLRPRPEHELDQRPDHQRSRRARTRQCCAAPS